MTEDGMRFEIATDEGTFEIVAVSAAVAVGSVYHYDRGALLQPGERIASWVKRGGEGGRGEERGDH
jgi:hypothetical protein